MPGTRVKDLRGREPRFLLRRVTSGDPERDRHADEPMRGRCAPEPMRA
jgi:hypothetical protein